MELSFLANIQRNRFAKIADELMNRNCILKYDSRDNSKVIYRFAEIEFYLYNADKQDEDAATYCRDCKCGEWFFHYSGVDIAFETKHSGAELVQFGGILVRGIEIYKQNKSEEWEIVGVVGGPLASMWEIFNHCTQMPEIVPLDDTFNKERAISEAGKRVHINDSLKQRFFFEDIDWSVPTERIVKSKTDGKVSYKLEKESRTYNPKA